MAVLDCSLLRKCLLALSIAMPAAAPAHAQTVTEYAAKAAFIYNVTLFSSLPHAHPSLRLCVFGRDPFGGALAAMEGRSVGQSRLTVAYPRSVREALDGCQILFISASEEASIGELTDAAGAPAPLTISDIKGAARRGVMLELGLENKRISFECNCKALRAAGIVLNASVLRLARVVY